MINQSIKLFNEAILDTDREMALKVIHDAIERGVTPEQVVFDIVIPSIETMINSLGEGKEISLAQHFITSQIAAEVTEAMIPKFKKSKEVIGHVVIGTSQGDFHGLGKRIVMGCLKALTIDVTDLGLNVSPERFVEKAVELNAEIIGISSMMVHTARGENACLKVRQILREKNLEDTIKIVVGGAPYRYDTGLYKMVKADAWADNGITAGKVITNLIKEVQK
jgi:trimethylamine corrinoid protein